MPRTPRVVGLYDLLACPVCRRALRPRAATLVCAGCGQAYPVVDGIPVLLPPRIDALGPDPNLPQHAGYHDWIHRTVLESLPADAIALEVGAGQMGGSRPNVIRMDVTLTPHVDVVGDAHAIPLLDEHLDFVFSLAVVEHLRQPFLAAQEMQRVLRKGGYLYAECSFVFPFHGHPHHYFNASHLGMAEIFRDLSPLRTGVAPHQMPSYAVRALLQTYLFFLSPHPDAPAQELSGEIRALLERDLGAFDDRFSQEAAQRVAACTYFFGIKMPEESEVIPPAVLRAYRRSAELQARFPHPLDLGVADNLMAWARGPEGHGDASIAAALDRPAFDKSERRAPALVGSRPWVRRGASAAAAIGRRLGGSLRQAGAAWRVEEIIDDGERVTHLFPNDCYVAHRSIYHFVVPQVAGAAVLDAGCGAGYGSAYLADHGARLVAGVDASAKAIAFSREHFVRPNLRYEVMNLERLDGLESGVWDVVICSNVLEHVVRVGAFLRRVASLLAPDGVFVLAVPPIVNDALRAQNLANPYHLNIWSPRQWQHALSRYFGEVQAYQHWYDKPGVELNLINSPADTVVREADFLFQAVSVDQLYQVPTITAVYSARRPLPADVAAAHGADADFIDDSFSRPPPSPDTSWPARARRTLRDLAARVPRVPRLLRS